MKDYLNEASQMGRPIIAMTGTFRWASVWTKDKKKKASGTPASISACFLAAGAMWPGSRTMTPLPWQTVSVRISPSFQSCFCQGLCHSSKNGKEYSALQFHAIRIPTQAYTNPLIKCLVPQACGPLQMSAVSFNMWYYVYPIAPKDFGSYLVDFLALRLVDVRQIEVRWR